MAIWSAQCANAAYECQRRARRGAEADNRRKATRPCTRGTRTAVFDAVAGVALRRASRVKYLVACRKQMGSIGINTGRGMG